MTVNDPNVNSADDYQLKQNTPQMMNEDLLRNPQGELISPELSNTY